MTSKNNMGLEIKELYKQVNYHNAKEKIKKIREYLNKKISQDPYPNHFDGTCPICFENTKNGWSILRECKHVFHGKCILEWYSNRISHGYDPKCPKCNAYFFDDEIIKKINN